jgi:hypothetical protein
VPSLVPQKPIYFIVYAWLAMLRIHHRNDHILGASAP